MLEGISRIRTISHFLNKFAETLNVSEDVIHKKFPVPKAVMIMYAMSFE